MSDELHEIEGTEREVLIAWLGDTPETVKSIHRLRHGLGRGLLVGPVDHSAAALVVALHDPEEHAGFGEDPESVWSLLRGVDGWKAIHVSPALAGPLAGVIEQKTGRRPSPIQELFFLPDGAIPGAESPEVRRLTPADAPLLETAADALGLHGWPPGSLAALATEGMAAGAVVGGELVAVGFAGFVSDRHAEVGIRTRPDHRNRGLSTAAAALVCEGIAASGRTPVWSTSEENAASRRVAAKLGFVEVSRRVYVNRG